MDIENGNETTEHPAVVAVETLVEENEISSEHASEVIETITENAQAQIDAAHEAAETVVEGAMLTALGKRFETLSQEFVSWQTERDALLQTMATLETTVAELVARMMVLEAAPQAVLSLSNPTPSAEATITLPVETLEPATLQNDGGENQEAQTESEAAKRKRRWT